MKTSQFDIFDSADDNALEAIEKRTKLSAGEKDRLFEASMEKLEKMKAAQSCDIETTPEKENLSQSGEKIRLRRYIPVISAAACLIAVIGISGMLISLNNRDNKPKTDKPVSSAVVSLPTAENSSDTSPSKEKPSASVSEADTNTSETDSSANSSISQPDEPTQIHLPDSRADIAPEDRDIYEICDDFFNDVFVNTDNLADYPVIREIETVYTGTLKHDEETGYSVEREPSDDNKVILFCRAGADAEKDELLKLIEGLGYDTDDFDFRFASGTRHNEYTQYFRYSLDEIDQARRDLNIFIRDNYNDQLFTFGSENERKGRVIMVNGYLDKGFDLDTFYSMIDEAGLERSMFEIYVLEEQPHLTLT